MAPGNEACFAHPTWLNVEDHVGKLVSGWRALALWKYFENLIFGHGGEFFVDSIFPEIVSLVIVYFERMFRVPWDFFIVGCNLFMTRRRMACSKEIQGSGVIIFAYS